MKEINLFGNIHYVILLYIYYHVTCPYKLFSYELEITTFKKEVGK